MTSGTDELRVSHRDRWQVVRALRSGARDGRLSDVTFISRLRLALDARRRSDLRAVTGDLPARGLWARAETAVRGWLARATAPRPSVAPTIAEVALRLPPAPGSYVIGRDTGCDLRLAEDTVSRRHAVLSCVDGEWLLADLGSTNGTRVNGWRLQAQAAVRAGDVVDLGAQRLRIVG